MNKIEKCQRSITESLIEIYLTEIVEDGKNKAIFKELEKDEARELITLMIYDRIQKPLSFKLDIVCNLRQNF